MLNKNYAKKQPMSHITKTIKASCILCQNESEMSFINKLRNDDTRFVYKCGLCGHIQLAPIPTIEEDEEYYKSDKMIRSLVSEDEMTDEQLRLKYEPFGEKQASKFKELLSLTKETKILEIGCGYGQFVEHMNYQGYDVDGMELDEKKCELFERRTGIKMKAYNILSDCKELEQDENKYDVVCMFQVFEHVDPNLFLSRIKKLLKTGGTIYIQVPNYNDYLKKLSTPFNDFTFIRAHLSYFTPETLTYALEKNNFIDINIYGDQNYSVENAINWIKNGTPIKSHCQLDLPKGLEFMENYYKEYLNEHLLCDFIIAAGKNN